MTTIYVADGDGTRARALTPGATGKLSPDGAVAVLARRFPGEDDSEIIVINTDGTGYRRLTDDAVDEVDPTWSADGTQIVYTQYTTSVSRLVASRPDGTGFHVLVSDPNYYYLDAAYPDAAVSPPPLLATPPPPPVVCGDVAVGQTYGGPGGMFAPNPSGYRGEPVNTATGAYFNQTTDLTLPGIALPFDLTRSYNSQSPLTGDLGVGWSRSYATRLEIDPARETIYLDADDGQRVRFDKALDGSYGGPAGTKATLVPAADGGFTVRRRDQLRYDFDTDGRLLKMTDRNGQSVRLAYGTDGQLATVTDTAGREIAFSHDGAGKLTKVTLPDGRYVGYGYDAGRLASVTDVRGGETNYAYDAAGRLRLITDQLGHTVVRNVYGSDGRVTDQYDARDKHTTFFWDAASQTSLTTDAAGNQYTDEYRGYYLLRKSEGPQRTSYGYDEAGNLIWTEDGAGNRTAMTYDSTGNMLTRTAPSPLSYREVWTWNSENDPTSYTDARGNLTTYGYDSAGNLHTTTEASGTSTEATTTYNHDPASGLLTDVVDPRGKTTTYGYDNQGNRESITTPLGDTATTSFDGAGRPVASVDPRGNVAGADPDTYKTTYSYDAANHLTQRADPYGNAWKWSYDASGNLVTRTDPNNHTTAYGHDDANHLTSVTAPDQTQTLYAYDSIGNVASRTDAKQHLTTYTYDAANRMTSVASQVGKWSYEYDSNGNVTKRIDPKGQPLNPCCNGATNYKYDALNRVTAIERTYPDSTPSVTLQYDGNSNLTKMIDGQGTEVRAYDELNRLTSATRGTDSFTYTYDVASNLATRRYPDGTTTSYAYDSDERLSSAAVGTLTTSYGYDAAGHLQSTTLPPGNGYAETRSYDRAGRLAEVKNAKGTSVLSDFAYSFDPAGNPTKVVTPGATKSYTFDQLDRLTQSCPGSSCTGVTPDIAYAYDAVGNRTSETRPTGATTFSYNAADQLTQTAGPAGTVAYTYDANGNETQAGARTFTYDGDNMLKSTTAGRTTITYAYTGDGRRAKMVNGNTTTDYLWDIQNELPQLALERTGNTVLRRYTYGAARVAMTTGGSDYYFHHDGLGSVANVTSSSGAAQLSYKYEPFGATTETKIASKPPTNPLRFTGALFDNDTGLYHLRARQYDPGTGRFTGVDPVLQGLSTIGRSPYVYADDRPTSLTDPSGLSPCWTHPWKCDVDVDLEQVKDIGNVVKNVLSPCGGYQYGTNAACDVDPHVRNALATGATCALLPEACIPAVAANAGYGAFTGVRNRSSCEIRVTAGEAALAAIPGGALELRGVNALIQTAGKWSPAVRAFVGGPGTLFGVLGSQFNCEHELGTNHK